MSRSTKKPIYKDRGLSTHEYWSVIRHEWKQKINENYYKDDFYLRNPKTIRNDWDYSDYTITLIGIIPDSVKDNFAHFTGWSKEEIKKYSRK